MESNRMSTTCWSVLPESIGLIRLVDDALCFVHRPESAMHEGGQPLT